MARCSPRRRGGERASSDDDNARRRGQIHVDHSKLTSRLGDVTRAGPIVRHDALPRSPPRRDGRLVGLPDRSGGEEDRTILERGATPTVAARRQPRTRGVRSGSNDPDASERARLCTTQTSIVDVKSRRPASSMSSTTQLLDLRGHRPDDAGDSTIRHVAESRHDDARVDPASSRCPCSWGASAGSTLPSRRRSSSSPITSRALRGPGEPARRSIEARAPGEDRLRATPAPEAGRPEAARLHDATEAPGAASATDLRRDAETRADDARRADRMRSEVRAAPAASADYWRRSGARTLRPSCRPSGWLITQRRHHDVGRAERAPRRRSRTRPATASRRPPAIELRRPLAVGAACCASSSSCVVASW